MTLLGAIGSNDLFVEIWVYSMGIGFLHSFKYYYVAHTKMLVNNKMRVFIIKQNVSFEYYILK